MIDANQVSAVVVTKGGYNIFPVLESLKPFSEVLVWDNSVKPDRKVFGRYLAALTAKNDIIYVQDDDCIVAFDSLLACWPAEGQKMICNVPNNRRIDYSRDAITLVGWGSLFHRKDIDVFRKYLTKYPEDELFDRECDRVFSFLNPHVEVDVPFSHMSYAFGQDRMGLEPRHGIDLKEIRKRLHSL